MTRALKALIALFIIVSVCAAQKQTDQAADPSKAVEELQQKFPGLLPEFGQLITKLMQEVHLPAERSRSTLLPLLPAGTDIYLAIPNYGPPSREALTVFRQELKDSDVLRKWWASGEMAKDGPKLEDAIDRFSQVCEYLGGEIVVAGTGDKDGPHVVVLAEIKKPGLKKLLEENLVQLTAKDKKKPDILILDPQSLATVNVKKGSDTVLVLVRPDYVVASTEVAAIRTYNELLDHSAREFASTDFAQRILHSYDGGLSVVGALNLKDLLTNIPPNPPQQWAMLQFSGFGDSKYAVWDHKKAAGRSISEAELSFTRPRHGMAAWLGKPTHLDSLDFVSPQAMTAFSVVLSDPAKIYDDVNQLNPAIFGGLAQTEQSLGISLRDDVLGQLKGEITIELDSVEPPKPAWKVIFRLNDPKHMSQTLAAVLPAMHLRAEPHKVHDVTYYVLRVPSPKEATEFAYAIVDNYLLFGSSLETLESAVALHGTSDSLAKSAKFQAALPPGHPEGVSGLWYQDPAAMMKFQMSRLPPDLAQSFAQSAAYGSPTVACVYGETDSIRQESTNGAVDVGAVLVIAAIAIPNLLRSRMAANEASAVGSMRTINVAQVTYASTFPDRGFSSKLAALGSGGNPQAEPNAEHAGLLDEELGCSTGPWCTRSGYKFTIKASCLQGMCTQYVAVATPVGPQTGQRSFCSVSDGVIRYKVVEPMTVAPTVVECKRWPPLQ